MRNFMKKKVKSRIMYGLILMALFIILLLKVFVWKSNREVDISDYIQVEFTGLNTMGKVNAKLNQEQLYTQLSGKEQNEQVLSNIKALIDSIKIETDGEDLSNENNVTIKVSYDRNLLKETKSNFQNTKFIRKVNGLEQGKDLDLFDHVEVVLSGASPEVNANIYNQWEDEDLKKITFHADKTAHIAKGDVITVTCDSSRDDLEKLGYVLKASSKTYGTDNVNSYVADVTSLNQNILQEIGKEAADTIKTETEDMTFRMLYKATNDTAFLYQDNHEKVNQTELVKALFLKKQSEAQDNTSDPDNYVYYIFKSGITNGTQTMDVYFIFEYSNGMVNKDNAFEMNHTNEKERYLCNTSLENLTAQVISAKESRYANQDITNMVK